MPDRNSKQWKDAVKLYREREVKGWQQMDNTSGNPGGVNEIGKHKNRVKRVKKGTLRGALFKNKSNGGTFGKHRG